MKHHSNTYKLCDKYADLDGKTIKQTLRIGNYVFIVTTFTILIIPVQSSYLDMFAPVDFNLLPLSIVEDFCKQTGINSDQIIESGDTTLRSRV